MRDVVVVFLSTRWPSLALQHTHTLNFLGSLGAPQQSLGGFLQYRGSPPEDPGGHQPPHQARGPPPPLARCVRSQRRLTLRCWGASGPLRFSSAVGACSAVWNLLRSEVLALDSPAPPPVTVAGPSWLGRGVLGRGGAKRLTSPPLKHWGLRGGPHAERPLIGQLYGLIALVTAGPWAPLSALIEPIHCCHLMGTDTIAAWWWWWGGRVHTVRCTSPHRYTLSCASMQLFV